MARAVRFLALATFVGIASCSDQGPTTPRTRTQAAPAARFAVGAGGPTRVPVPGADDMFDFPAGAVCSFELVGTPVSNRGVITTFAPDANGDVRQLITGTLVETFSNAGTSRSLTVNISGPFQVVMHADGSATFTLNGPTLVFFFPGDVPSGPQAFINSGRAVIDFTTTGQQILESRTGNVQDLCAALS